MKLKRGRRLPKPSIYSKGTILDLLTALGSGACLDLEMQVAAQEFIPKRIEVYTSDLVMMQYTVCRGEKKDVLDKCLHQWLSGSCPAELTELAVWLCTIADINNEKVKEATRSNPVFRKMRQELEIMGKDREELAKMLFDKYEEAVRYSGLQQAKREGRAEGRKDGEQLKLIELIQKKVKKGKTASEISDALEENPEIVDALYRLITDNPEKDEEELLECWNHPSHKE